MTRLACAAAAFAFCALWELVFPSRPYATPRLRRWAVNIGLQAVNLLLVAAVLSGPALSLGALAEWAEVRRLGLLNVAHFSFPVKFALSFILLDLAVWAQHWAFHVAPPLWRLHQVHHTDLDLDVTTGLRFHPGEIAVSLALKAAAVVLLGAHFLAVFVFELVLNAASLFTHMNGRLPRALEPLVRALIVTPDMHRVHHSARLAERDSNFGFFLSLWDRLMGTYEAEAAGGATMMELGLPEHRKAEDLTFGRLLKLPFSK